MSYSVMFALLLLTPLLFFAALFCLPETGALCDLYGDCIT
ncbi:putative membrane protein [Escherichia coli 179550]|nr:putative membrane protein [Escherichia coli 2866450]EMW60293.1 putative membrane protein [Escherichia coli 2756500]ENA63799.1 putative membrane protein [Escherichia coli 179550]